MALGDFADLSTVEPDALRLRLYELPAFTFSVCRVYLVLAVRGPGPRCGDRLVAVGGREASAMAALELTRWRLAWEWLSLDS